MNKSEMIEFGERQRHSPPYKWSARIKIFGKSWYLLSTYTHVQNSSTAPRGGFEERLDLIFCVGSACCDGELYILSDTFKEACFTCYERSEPHSKGFESMYYIPLERQGFVRRPQQTLSPEVMEDYSNLYVDRYDSTINGNELYATILDYAESFYSEILDESN